VSWVPGLNDIEVLALIIWVLMYLQIIVATLYSYPIRSSCHTDYGYAAEEHGYANLVGYKVHHSDALKALALANRMVSVYDRHFDWQLSRVEFLLSKSHLTRDYNMLLRELRSLNYQMWFFSVLQRSCLLEFQISIFAVCRALTPHTNSMLRGDHQMLITIGFGFFSLCKVLVDSYAQRKAVKRCTENVRRLEKRNRYTIVHECERDMRALQTHVQCFSFGIVILILVLLHTASKLVMAFYCEDSLWNVPLNDGTPIVDGHGCVIISRSLRHGEM